MAVELFGFSIGRVDKDAKNKKSFVLPEPEDGALEVGPAGGAYGTYVDLEGIAKNEQDLIRKYREMATFPECDQAIDDVVNDAIVASREESPVSINLEKSNLSDNIKESVKNEFIELVRLLSFRKVGFELFRKWYVDGRLYFHIIIDEKNPKRGILELRSIDPLKIKKIRQPRIVQGPEGPELDTTGFQEFYLFNEKGISDRSGGQAVTISEDSISYVHSGVLDADRKIVLSHLHKAIKPLNQLRMLEDAVVIYRISRAPERRIFYIDVGNLPKIKAEQYLRDIMNKYKNKLVYDSNSGEVKDERKHMSMLEDYWLPRREGGRGTEITTLPGGENLGELADVDYFKTKLYKALNVPPSRLEQDSGFILGRAEEISRDEVKFTRFVERLRGRFNMLFNDLLEKQLLLKGVVSSQDWLMIKDFIIYEWQTDSHFAELKDAQMMKERLSILTSDMGYRDDVVGKFFSIEYINKKVLKLTQEEIDAIQDQIEKEQAAGDIKPNEDQWAEYDPSKDRPDLKVISG
ncbi:portal protein [Candidatus Woesearchaeota archaeon]|nr:portal protein [Candidatus Woesearchaeota archaeon]